MGTLSLSLKPKLMVNYDHSILSLISSVLKHYGVQTPYKTLPAVDEELKKGYKNIIFMVFDAMGDVPMKKILPPESFLCQKQIDTIHSMYPSTTAACMTSLYSGVPPIVHGWLGWQAYFKEYDKVVEYFTNRNFYTKEDITEGKAADLVQYEHIFDKIKKATKGEVQIGDLSAPFRPGRPTSIRQLCEKSLKFADQEGRHFIFAYWPDPDHSGHLTSPEATLSNPTEAKKGKVAPPSPYAQVVRAINQRLHTMSKKMKDDTLILVTADHGMMTLEKAIYANDCGNLVDCLAHPISLDERITSIFLKPGKEAEFKKLYMTYLKKDFAMMSREEVFKYHLFGEGEPHSKALDFIGDYVLIGITNKSLRQRYGENYTFFDMKGVHSGMTEAEINVPLIMISKK